MPSLYAPCNPGLDRDGRAADGHRFVAIFLAVVALLTLVGCQSLELTPRGEYAATAEAYDAALDSAARLAQSGRLTLDDALLVERQRATARTALDQADRILTDPARPPTDARLWLYRAQGAIAEITKILRKYEVPT